MSNKLKIIMAALVAVLIVAAVFGAFYFINKAKKGQSPVESQDSLFLSGVTESEKAAVANKTEQQVELSFMKEKSDCVNRFRDTKEGDLSSADSLQAWSITTCQAVKNNNVNECDKLKENQADWQKCQEMSGNFLNFYDAVFTKKDCSLEFLVGDERFFCQGVTSGDIKSCEQSSDATHKKICLAIVNDDIAVCDQPENVKEKEGCRNLYYFAKAAEKKDLSYLENIKSGTTLALSRLFFDKNLSCPDLLDSSNKEYCGIVFSDEQLDRRMSIWTALNKK